MALIDFPNVIGPDGSVKCAISQRFEAQKNISTVLQMFLSQYKLMGNSSETFWGPGASCDTVMDSATTNVGP